MDGLSPVLSSRPTRAEEPKEQSPGLIELAEA